MIKLIKNVDVYTPSRLGKKDILVAGGRIAAIEDQIDRPGAWPMLEIIDGRGDILAPGLIDNHVHILGGGGEDGFGSRTPELSCRETVSAGVTTVIGVRGLDDVTRTGEGLVAKAKELKENGLSCWVLAGSYQTPVSTITGKIDGDIMMIDEIIGVGELALSDHRSSHVTYDELVRIVAKSYVGGMMSGKAGITNIHMGGDRDWSLLERLVKETDLPRTVLVPTHINRSPDFLEKGMRFALDGGNIDLTATRLPESLRTKDLRCSRVLKTLLDNGVELSRITFSSDGQGSIPVFDQRKKLIGFDLGRCNALFKEVRDAVLEEGIPLETALTVITSNPADIYCLKRKGRIVLNHDADFILIKKEDLSIRTVMAQGRVLQLDGQVLTKGRFED